MVQIRFLYFLRPGHRIYTRIFSSYNSMNALAYSRRQQKQRTVRRRPVVHVVSLRAVRSAVYGLCVHVNFDIV